MPLDGRNWKQDTETKPDLSKPSLEGLSWLLRHLRTELPNHRYEHSHFAITKKCGTAGCACGVCQIVWPSYFPRYTQAYDMWGNTDRIFGEDSYGRIFSVYAYCFNPSDVTEIMVADRIDAYLAETRK